MYAKFPPNFCQAPVPSDEAVSKTLTLQPMDKIAQWAGLEKEEYVQYGRGAAKVFPEKVEQRLKNAPRGLYVLVAGVSPTSLGEGKSTTTVGLAQAFGAHLERKCVACVRQPSQVGLCLCLNIFIYSCSYCIFI